MARFAQKSEGRLPFISKISRSVDGWVVELFPRANGGSAVGARLPAQVLPKPIAAREFSYLLVVGMNLDRSERKVVCELTIGY